MAPSTGRNFRDADTLVYEGCNFFRQRLILATLSGKNVKIKNIRHKDDDPGLREFEASFIRLLDKITNGSNIEVNETGTAILYQPGLLHGGKISHDCCTQRSIGYYLEPLLCLGPFCKKPLEVTLTGVTNDQTDPSVDNIRHGSIPVLKKFLQDDEGIELKTIKRGAPPNGGGEIFFSCPISRYMRPLQFTDPGKIKRIRGVAYTMRVAPNIASRMVEVAKGVLLKFLPDVYIYTDHYKGESAGKSPGFGISLVAETTTGAFLTAERFSNPSGTSSEPSVPEDIAKNAAYLLLEEIYRGGCVDSTNQSMACLFMALGQRDVSKVITGPLSPYLIEFLRHMRDFFRIMFKVEVEDAKDDLKVGAEKISITCVGIGYSNLNKTTI